MTLQSLLQAIYDDGATGMPRNLKQDIETATRLVRQESMRQAQKLRKYKHIVEQTKA